MKIVICSGGTGSIALQTGLFKTFQDIDGVDIKILINAYDNGKSTGDVRRVAGGKILGPSDMRKNQTTRLSLENPKSPWLKYLDIRFTEESTKAKNYCEEQTDILKSQITNDISEVYEAIEIYFKQPSAEKINYTDFALANIVYAGLSIKHNNSLRMAGTVMARLMGISDNVILNDDTSLFLGAISKSGEHVSDEGDIVAWGKQDDPFVNVYFTNTEGYYSNPVLCNEARDALINADLIILSSGTFWASLMPTYVSAGFKEVMALTKAKVLMVMNRFPDTDSPGQTGEEIINALVPSIFKEKQITIIADSSGSPQMNAFNEDIFNLIDKRYADSLMIMGEISPSDMKKHNPIKLARLVGVAYFGDTLTSSHFMFDYDDTLVGRGNKLPKSSRVNIVELNRLNAKLKNSLSICTGNSIKAIDLNLGEWNSDNIRSINIFADGGVNNYTYLEDLSSNGDNNRKITFNKCVNKSFIIPEEVINQLLWRFRDAGIQFMKIEIRGNVMISIKPIEQEYRKPILTLVKMILAEFPKTKLVAKLSGRTTIEIAHEDISKAHALKSVLQQPIVTSITYVGDELLNGNDSPIAILAQQDSRIKTLNVSSPSQTAFFLKTLSRGKSSYSL